MEEVLKIIKLLAEKRFIKDISTTINIKLNTDYTRLVVNILNMSNPELFLNDILEFHRDIYNECNIGSFNDIVIKNNAGFFIIEIPLLNKGINN